jgi:hypothetical protein
MLDLTDLGPLPSRGSGELDGVEFGVFAEFTQPIGQGLARCLDRR